MEKRINKKMKWLPVVVAVILAIYSCAKDNMPPSGVLQNVHGKVTDSRGGNPVVGAQVRIGIYNPVTSDSSGNYRINNILIDKSIPITASKAGYDTLKSTVYVASGVDNGFPILMIPQTQITIGPTQPLKIDANEKNKTLTLKNVGSQGPISVTVKTDPTDQWLTVIPPKDPVIEPGGLPGQFIVVVDSKGITTLGDRSAKLHFVYKGTKTSYTNNEDYEVIMSVTTLSVTAIPAISNLVPVSGGYGTNVTITGQNFETDTSKVQVLFEGNKKALITSATPTELKVKVPVGAKTGTVRVVIGQVQAVSNAIFTYNLACIGTPIAQLNTLLYLNDITTASDGTIFVCGVDIQVQQGVNQILRSGVYRLNRNSTRETPLLEGEAGFANGSLNSTAKIVNPTKIVAVNNDIYVVDQYDDSRYRVNYTEGFVSIRRIANNEITAIPPPYYAKLKDGKGFIGDIVFIPNRTPNGLAFSDGVYKKYGLDGNLEILTGYQGLNVFLDFDGTDVYSLDLLPSTNPTRWELHRRSADNLLDKVSTPIAAGNLGIPSKDMSPDNNNYPKGMVIDPVNQCVYIFDRQTSGSNTFINIVYRVELGSNNAFETIPCNINSSVSCVTYDVSRQAVVVAGVNNFGNQVLALEFK